MAPSREVEQVFCDAGDVMAEDLLKRAGCGGMSAGGAAVSSSCPNSIRVSQRCSSADVLALARAMRDAVVRSSGIELNTRLRFVDRRGVKVAL